MNEFPKFQYLMKIFGNVEFTCHTFGELLKQDQFYILGPSAQKQTAILHTNFKLQYAKLSS